MNRERTVRAEKEQILPLPPSGRTGPGFRRTAERRRQGRGEGGSRGVQKQPLKQEVNIGTSGLRPHDQPLESCHTGWRAGAGPQPNLKGQRFSDLSTRFAWNRVEKG